MKYHFLRFELGDQIVYEQMKNVTRIHIIGQVFRSNFSLQFKPLVWEDTTRTIGLLVTGERIPRNDSYIHLFGCLTYDGESMSVDVHFFHELSCYHQAKWAEEVLFRANRVP